MNNMYAAHIGAWARWLMVVILLIAKCYVFDAIIAQPGQCDWTLTDWLAKSAAATLLALPVVFTERKYPVFVILCLADIWMIVNILYFRAYKLFITWHLFSLATNINGFESSLLPYCSISLCLLPLLTLPALICCYLPSKRLGIVDTFLIILIAAILSISASHNRWTRHAAQEKPFSWEWMNPCVMPQTLSVHVSESEKQVNRYIAHHSILSYPLFMAHNAAHSPFWKRQVITFTEEEEEELKKFINPVVQPHLPEGNLLIILLESFESWLMESVDADGNLICPSLNEYIATHENVLYVRDTKTQIKYGMSGDGQMIINTGLLPISEGVACVNYAYNTYPNLAHFYPYSAIVNPCRNVWNQTIITNAYGYKELIEPTTENRFEWNDSIVVDKIMATFYQLPSPTCVMGITVSGHMPFDSSPDNIPVSDTIPELFRNYMRTARFTDRQLGRLLQWADTASVMNSSTIAITGDHRIFHAWLNDEVRNYGLQAGLPFGTGQAGCPFILITPHSNKKVVNSAMQIDIFPTILNAIGQSDYFWKGFGCDLLSDDAPIEESPIQQQLSDKLIQEDWFKHLSTNPD